MDDELFGREIDDRIQRAVHVDSAAAQRIASAALDVAVAKRPRVIRQIVLIAAVIAVVIAAGVAGWRRESVSRARARAASLSIRGIGSTVVIDGDAGQRWIVGPVDSPPSHGGYVIVFTQ